MATTRPIALQQPRVGEEGLGVKPEKKVDGEMRNNRRALNDIGNLVTGAQITRPITRSFGAQLLAKAQTGGAAIDNNKKKSDAAAINGAQLVAKKKVLQPAQKKICAKQPKPQEEIIVISPDTEEEKLNHRTGNYGSCSSGSRRRKKAPTTTSILTARSMSACGVVVADKKPKEQIIDIDADDLDDELAVVEYIEDIQKFYKLTENETRAHDYMGSQPELNEKMRAILVDWLIEVHNRFELMPETLYLAINLLDRFLCVKTVPRRELQLVGISAMLIACKYEEIWAPEVNDFISISDRVYSNEQILKMEKSILGKLEWNITVPTPYVFLVRFIKASMADEELENMVYFLAELAATNYTALVHCPSMLSASSVYVARLTLNKTPAWTETLELHTGFTEPQLIDCARLLVTLHSAAEDNKLQVVFRKYSKAEQYAVALTPPARSILASLS